MYIVGTSHYKHLLDFFPLLRPTLMALEDCGVLSPPIT